MKKILFLIGLIVYQPIYATTPGCSTLEDEFTVAKYADALSKSPASVLGVEVVPVQPRSYWKKSIPKYLQAIGNSAVTISENAIFKKGILDFGYPLEHPSLLGYRIQTQYTLLRGLKVKGQSFERRAILSKVELIDKNGSSITILRSKDGSAPTSAVMLVIPKIVESMGPITVQKLIKKEIQRINEEVQDGEYLLPSIQPRLTRLKSLLRAEKIGELKQELTNILQADYNAGKINFNNQRLDVEVFIDSRTLEGVLSHLSRFFTNPSKKLSNRAYQESLQSINGSVAFRVEKYALTAKNFKEWMVDRTKRQFGNAPSSILIGILAGALGAAIATYFSDGGLISIDTFLRNTEIEGDTVVAKTADGSRDLVIHAKRNGTEAIRFLLVHKGGFDFAFEPINLKKPLRIGDNIEYTTHDGRKVVVTLDKINLKDGYIWP